MNYKLSDGTQLEIAYETEGWDWADQDFSWLSSNLTLPEGGFFIHGGLVRHQRHIPCGDYTIEEFVAALRKLAGTLEHARVVWMEDTGFGDAGLWVEGLRAPTQADAEALAKARMRQLQEDERMLGDIEKRRLAWESEP